MLHLRRVTLGSLLAATCLSFPLLPASAFACELSEPQKGTVAEIKDGETLQLTDGTVVRLVNAKAPTAAIAARDDRPWPMVNEAKEALSKLASGAEVELRYGSTRTDRHGYALFLSRQPCLRKVLAADNVERLVRLTRSYQLVEGVVAQVGDSGARI
jgi:hypothetical protein